MASAWPAGRNAKSFKPIACPGWRSLSSSTLRLSQNHPTIPKATIDIRHIRENPALHAQNCLHRNYVLQSEYPARIITLFDQWKGLQEKARSMRQENNELHTQFTTVKTVGDGDIDYKATASEKSEIIIRARELREGLRSIEHEEIKLEREMKELAIDLPNLTSAATPLGNEGRVLDYFNEPAIPREDSTKTDDISHVQIGLELQLLDFVAANTTSGWGWYFLKNEAALLEQALVQYSLSVAMQHGFAAVSPPSMVYSHILSACGYQPRDQSVEQQIYCIQQNPSDAKRGKPELSLTGTAEIPFAGMKSNTNMEESELPLRIVGSSRCYRAEAGSRGVDTKGLYRVHEFTKVEMFGWTRPDIDCSTKLLQEMLAVQSQILRDLGLYCRILEQPSADLGASAARKQDIEAMFPSRRNKGEGWGEVTSASICTDYQSRRLGTRVRTSAGGKLAYPYTVNGTAVAVPRILAAILETHWDAKEACVRVPEVLWPWMHGITLIRKRS